MADGDVKKSDAEFLARFVKSPYTLRSKSLVTVVGRSALKGSWKRRAPENKID